MLSDYYGIRKWLENYIPHTWTRKELGLERIGYILNLLGNPQNKFKSIHIAGTSGKGSTAYYIARLLEISLEVKGKDAGLVRRSGKRETSLNPKTLNQTSFLTHKLLTRPKIGLHLSPHLVDIRERLQINGKLIPMNRFVKIIGEIKPFVESMKDSKVGLPSYFEILVAASFLYFAKERVDWAVVEVGLGGRLDATNVLNPQLTVITNVGLDHTDILGTKVEKIAYEKAGIIKPKVPIVTGAVSKALEVIEKVAKQKKAPLITVDTQSLEKTLKSDLFNNINLPIDIFRSTPYSFVFSNKLLALAAVKTLEIPLQKRQTAKAFSGTFPGRLEEIEKGVILDGAHNADKVRSLIEFVRNSKLETRNSKQIQKSKIQNPKSIILVIAFKKGKDWKKMIDLLVKNLPVNQVIATKFHAVTDMGKHQAVDPKEIARYIKSKWKVKVESQNNSHGAVFEAVNCQLSTVNCLILITGSLYLVGEVRTIWKLPAC